MQNYDDDRDKENIFEMDVSYPKHLQKMNSIFSFCPKKLTNARNLSVICLTRKNALNPLKSSNAGLNYGLAHTIRTY